MKITPIQFNWIWLSFNGFEIGMNLLMVYENTMTFFHDHDEYNI
jgi:hypothetical protein